MTFRQFAFNNVFRNKRLYAAYFLSSLFTVMVFFTFAIFAFHPELSGEGTRQDVLIGMSVAGGIIYIFSFFFVLYSMSSFLQSRKKEFGVLLIHGMSNRQIRWMVFLENMVIGFFATILGILIGLIFSKGILLIAENVLVIDQSLHFYFPLNALVITFISFTVLFFFISVFVTFILRTNKLTTLIKGNKIGKAEPKFSIILVILAILLLGSGYWIALAVKGVYVAFALIPVSFLVTTGTYFLFTQLSVFIIRKLKQSERVFWKKTNMLLFSDLSYRMKDNARAFFMVAIISTVAFSAIGTLIGLNSFITKGVIEANPTSYSYYLGEGDMDEAELNENIQLIEDTLQDNKLTYEKANVKLNYFEQGKDKPAVLIATAKQYNEFAQLIGEKQIEIKSDEIIHVDTSGRMIDMPGMDYTLSEITLADGSTVKVNAEKSGIAKPDVLREMYEHYIVGEDVYNKLADPVRYNLYFGWHVISGDRETVIQVGEELTNTTWGGFMAIDYAVNMIQMVYSPIMLVGLFIGIIFFVSAGSFLYFRLYTDLDDDKEKFKSIGKIGLTIKELRKVVSRQTAILFFAPIIVAIIHGAVALTALSHMFEYNLVKESALVLGSFFIIQVIYFVVVRYFYTRQIENAVK